MLRMDPAWCYLLPPVSESTASHSTAKYKHTTSCSAEQSAGVTRKVLGLKAISRSSLQKASSAAAQLAAVGATNILVINTISFAQTLVLQCSTLTHIKLLLEQPLTENAITCRTMPGQHQSDEGMHKL